MTNEEPILVTKGLCKRYAHFYALQPADVTLQRGQIYGLVGKNGAGKTTLLRLITGQTVPTSGELCLFSEKAGQGLHKSRRRTGAMIETPCFFPYMTAGENLEYYRLQRGIPGKHIVPELLAEVELMEAGKKRFRDFSLGMKQRLGLALAMMNRPELLLLDEPVNGLDPMGIVSFRNLLLRLNRERGITMMISSHILSELESLASCYGFIDHGTLLEELSSEELNARCRQYMELTVSDQEQTAAILGQKLGCTEFEILPKNVIRLYRFLDEPDKVSQILIDGGVKLLSMGTKGTNLEEYFLSLIGGGAHA